MEEYKLWLEKQIERCLEDKDLQREHWAFCQALSKYRELALRQPPVSSSVCEHRNYRQGWNINQPCICNDCGEEL